MTMAAILTRDVLIEHNAALSKDEDTVRNFLRQKLAGDVLSHVLSALRCRKGFLLSQYSEEEIGAIAMECSRGSLRKQLDIGRGLIRLHDGLDTWSSTVSDRESMQDSSVHVVPLPEYSKDEFPGIYCDNPERPCKYCQGSTCFWCTPSRRSKLLEYRREQQDFEAGLTSVQPMKDISIASDEQLEQRLQMHCQFCKEQISSTPFCYVCSASRRHKLWEFQNKDLAYTGTGQGSPPDLRSDPEVYEDMMLLERLFAAKQGRSLILACYPDGSYTQF